MPRKTGNPPCHVTCRKLVRDRDNNKCVLCGRKGNVVHKIKSQKDYPELSGVVANSITLCEECDKKLFHVLRYIKYLKDKNWGHLLNANK